MSSQQYHDLKVSIDKHVALIVMSRPDAYVIQTLSDMKEQVMEEVRFQIQLLESEDVS